jgi:hypothetical protein
LKSGDANRVGRFGTKHGGRNLNDEVKMNWPAARATERGEYQRDKGKKDGVMRATLIGAVRMWPSATAQEGTGYMSGSKRDVWRPGLAEAVKGMEPVKMWQTPSTGNFRTRGGDRKDELGLDREVKMWAAPCAWDHQGSHGGGQGSHGGGQGRSLRTDMSNLKRAGQQVAGQLNPDWDELLMGWPPGWTALPEATVLRLRAEARISSRGNRRAPAKATPTDPSGSAPSETGKTPGP